MGTTLVLVIVIAIIFDFTNGFHDTANSIATMVGTRALDPKLAVILAAVAQLRRCDVRERDRRDGRQGDHRGEAATRLPSRWRSPVSSGRSRGTSSRGSTVSRPPLRTRSSAGSSVLHSRTVVRRIFWTAPEFGGVTGKVLIPSLLAPTLGLLGGTAHDGDPDARLLPDGPEARATCCSAALQILSGGWLSFSHGLNDAQKTMGVMMLALIAAGNLSPATVESAAVGQGERRPGDGRSAPTPVAGRSSRRLGGKVVKMSPMQGFSASMAGASDPDLRRALRCTRLHHPLGDGLRPRRGFGQACSPPSAGAWSARSSRRG